MLLNMGVHFKVQASKNFSDWNETKQGSEIK